MDEMPLATHQALTCLVFGLLVLTACGPQARPPAATAAVRESPVSPSTKVPAQATPAPTVATAGQVGYLEVQATIGPLQPVERVGVPSPTPPAAACTARGLVIYAADSGIEVQRFSFGPDCSYRVALPPGMYRTVLDRRGIDNSKDLPQVVTINAGQTTRLNVSIDTGIR